MVITGEKKFEYVGEMWRATIDDDREVFVLREGDAFLLAFLNGERRTNICVTDEAAWALFCALGASLDVPVTPVAEVANG